MSLPHLERSSRVMVLVPHPDDETLATGGLLQQVRAAGGALRVVFLTSGENNPWPQRVIERRWVIGPAERRRWGRLRQREALAALATLGVSPDEVVFLGMPDRVLTQVLLNGGRKAIDNLAEEIVRWRPSLLVSPSTSELHPDHSATAVLVRFALNHLPSDLPGFDRLEYVVHGRPRRHPVGERVSLHLSEEQRQLKRRAILCHASQLKLRPRSLLARGRRTEDFLAVPHKPPRDCTRHPVRRAVINDGHLHLVLCMRPYPGAFGRATLYLVAGDDSRTGVKLRACLSPAKLLSAKASGPVEIRDVTTGALVAMARYRGDRRRGLLLLPRHVLGGAERVFVKLERRWGFFDEAGWRELPVSAPHPM